SKLSQIDESLTLLTCLNLIQAMKTEDRYEIKPKLDILLKELPAIHESGMPLRDCLLVSGYALSINSKKYPHLFFNDILIPRMNYALDHKWVGGDARLALISSVLKINRVSELAASYLDENA